MRKKGFLIFMLILTLSVSLFFINSESVFASIFGNGAGEDTVAFLNTYNEYLTYGNFFSVILHQIGWGLVKVVYILISSIESLIPQTFDLLDFLNSAGINNLTSSILNDLVLALMIIAIVFLGFKTIVAKEPPKFKSVGVNILVSALLITGLPTLMNTMQEVAIGFYQSTQKGTNNEGTTSLAWSLVQDSTTDLLYLSEIGFNNVNSNDTKNKLTPESLKKTNLNALLTPDLLKEADGEEIKHLEYKLEQSAQGEDIAVKIDSGALGFFSSNFEEGYFRYDVSFLPIIVGLIALMVAYLFAIFVLVTTIIEIGIKKVVALFVFPTDLESGQRTKMVVQDIFNAYLLIAFTGLNMLFYTSFLTYLSKATPNIIIYLIAIISATFVLIKGSNTIMRYFGVDTGVKEGFGQLAGAFAVGRATKGGLGNIGKALGNATSGVKDTLSNKQSLQEQGSTAPSIRDQNTHKTPTVSRENSSNSISGLLNKGKESINNANETIGNLSSQGASGIIQGATAATLQGKSVNNASPLKAQGVRNIEDDIYTEESTQMNGSSLQNSQAKLNNNRQNGTYSDEQEIASGAKKQSINQELNSINSIQPKEEKIRVTEEREPKNVGQNNNLTNSSTEVIGNTKLNSNADTSINKGEVQEIVQNTKLNPAGKQSTINQESNQGDQSSSTNKPLRQDISQVIKPDQTSKIDNDRQNVTQDVHKGSINQAGATVRQNVEQDLKQASIGTQTTRNSVISDVQNASLNNSATSRQNVVQDVKQSVSVPQQATQRITQQLDRTEYKNADQIKQNVIQEIQKNAVGTPEMKQRVIQQIEQANIATPQQATQNVQQVLTSARLPQEAQQSVQKVIQEVQRSGNITNEDLKTKVVQELETANFGTKEPIKQVIMQNVQKAFSATPEQVTQNVKQVIQNQTTTSNIQSSNTVQQENQLTKNSYFGKMFSEDLMEQDVKPPVKRGTRFNAIKNL